MHLHNEDLELQIRLAELQADVQMNLTAAFGSFAGFLAVLLTCSQLCLQPEPILDKTVVFIVMVVFAVLSFAVAVLFVRKALTYRKQIGELKKKYVW